MRAVNPPAALAAVLALLALWGTSPAPRAEEGMSPRRRLCHLLQRVTFGATPSALAEVEAQGPRVWLHRQLQPGPEPELEARFAVWPHFMATPRDVFVHQFEHDYELDAEGRREVNALPVLEQLIERRLLAAVESRHQLREMMVEFWFNHFNAFWDKGDAVYWAMPEYVEQAIRPRALGRFRDLLGATARSTAMLVYLDNWKSSGTLPGGLNENYARELLELHTVGVDAGYTQDDVVNAARCLAGWTVVDRGDQRGYPAEDSLRFRFDPDLHDDRPKKVMDLDIPPGGGQEDGELLLDYLAAHPATARFVCGKLARRFVDDDPPPALVDRMAGVFLATDGDVARVMECLLTSSEFYDPRYYRSKMKTPLEVVASTMRIMGMDALPGMAGSHSGTRWPDLSPAEALENLGAPQFQCLLPTGYPDRKEDWDHSGSLHRRLSWAKSIGLTYGPGFLAKERLALSPEAFAERIVLEGVSPATRRELDRAMRQETLDEERGVRMLAVLLSSPEFQTR